MTNNDKQVEYIVKKSKETLASVNLGILLTKKY